MTSSAENPIPEVYVLWHPRCTLGESLARLIYAWLRPGNGLGPQVFYRSLAAPEASPGGLPPPLPGEFRLGFQQSKTASRVSNLQVVLPLIDENMIADAAWRHWLAQLASPSSSCSSRVVIPVALDSTAFNVPEPLRKRNFLRPAGLPIPAAVDSDDLSRKSVGRSLLKQLTEALCDLMLGRNRVPSIVAPANVAIMREDVLPKVKIFLSHAKADGTTPAKRIRDYIYSQTQLAAFYDENDIPFGSVFNRVLLDDIQSEETAALIVVRSEFYASRPWCRRELSLFRRPFESSLAPATAQRWRLNPTIVVDALEGGRRTLGIPELGNTPIIRWADDVKDQEEQIVTTVLRDALLSAFHVAVGRAIPDAPDRVILSWRPDPTTLLHIPRVRAAHEEIRILYPGRSLSGLELDILDEFFPQLEFHSFEEVIS